MALLQPLSNEHKTYLRGRTARVTTWQERQQMEEEKEEARRIKAELAEFSDKLHAWHVTEDGQCAANSVTWEL